MRKLNMIISSILALLPLVAMGQNLITSGGDPNSNTTVQAPSNQWDINYQGTRSPRVTNNYPVVTPVLPVTPYVLSPFAITLRQPTRRITPVAKYTDVQYGNLISQTVAASTVQPAGARQNVPSILDKAADAPTNPDTGEKILAANVVDVLDRGLLVLDTYDEVKLRGVDMSSEDDVDDVTRYYARLGIDTLRRLLINQQVYIQLGTPERDADGPILADVVLADGSLVNRQILELGYGRFDKKDFLPDQIPVTLQAAEQRARNAKVGLFSK